MRIDYKKTESTFSSLTSLQKLCYITAVFAAFTGIFTWFFKILFF